MEFVSPSKMTIGIDVRSLMEGRHSGVEEYAIKVIRAMVEQAPKENWVLFYNSWRKVQLPEFSPKIQIVAFRYPNKILNLLQFAFGRPRWDQMIEKKIGMKPSVIFLPNARLMPLVDTPLVVTSHDLSYELFPEFYSWRRRLWHKLMRPRNLLQQATQIIAVSEATKDDLRRLYGIRADKISVVHSGVGERKMPVGDPKMHGSAAQTEIDTVSKEVGAWPQRYILYLGTLEPRKNIVSIIEAFTACAHRIPQDLVIAGEKGWLGRRVRQAVENSTVSRRIHQIGCVTEEEKWQLYEKADLFIYPSFYEGFGFPPLEAIVAGTPAVIANNSSLPEVAGNFATMINPYDVAELALVMEELLKNPEVVTKETVNKIKKQYSWTETARKTLLVLRAAAIVK